MNTFVKSLFLFGVFVMTTNPSFSEEDVTAIHSTEEELDHKIDKLSFAYQSKPIKEFVTDIFKIYKSTYLGNKTFAEYRNDVNERFRQQQIKKQEEETTINTAEGDYEVHVDENEGNESTIEEEPDEDPDADPDAEPDAEPDEKTDEDPDAEPNEKTDEDPDDQLDEEQKEPTYIITTTPKTSPPTTPLPKQETKNKLLPKKKIELDKIKNKSHIKEYNVGPALNLSLDMSNNIVKVNLDGESLRELVTGRWLNDNTEQGRGKKYEMVTRILPLFILPFLIQSAIVPFLVTKLKLLLMKSMLVGKLAIFLLIISAFRNSNKQMQTYEVAPSYWAGEPSRRSELAAAASNMAYNGYRVEGKPAAWVN